MATNQTNHYKNKRYKREKFINKYICDDGNIVDEFIIDKGHPMGAEIHAITDNGIIIIRNLKTKKLVTKLIARPHQIMRYYKSTGRKPPPNYEHILYIAEWHKSLGYNNV